MQIKWDGLKLQIMQVGLSENFPYSKILASNCDILYTIVTYYVKKVTINNKYIETEKLNLCK